MRKLGIVTLAVVALAAFWATRTLADKSFVRLAPLGKPKIVAAAQEFAGGGFPAEHLLDGLPLTEYASNGKGTDTFVEFDLGSGHDRRFSPRQPQRSGPGGSLGTDV